MLERLTKIAWPNTSTVGMPYAVRRTGRVGQEWRREGSEGKLVVQAPLWQGVPVTPAVPPEEEEAPAPESLGLPCTAGRLPTTGSQAPTHALLAPRSYLAELYYLFRTAGGAVSADRRAR